LRTELFRALTQESFNKGGSEMNYRRIARWCCLATVIAIAALVSFRTYSLYAEDAKVAETKQAEVAASPAVEKPVEVKPEEKKPDPPVAPAPSVALVTTDDLAYAVDNVTLFLAAVLVIFMQAGFALVETGLNAAKNAVNIMFKNYMDFCLGALLFFAFGFGLMYPDLMGDKKTVLIPGVLEFGTFGIPASELGKTVATDSARHPLGNAVNFLFQVAFCATAATIVSGSVAGRIKFSSYLVYTAFISGIVYPISGMWMWGGGWLFDLGFKDFAGSVVVHTVGGFAGLAGAIALGPRIGKFVNGKAMPMPGHNLTFACLGVFILLIGWYGFNPGSQLVFTGGVNVDTVMMVAVNTTLAACTGSIAGMFLSWILFKKPDLTFALNGGLAGLVAITANCHCVSYPSALAIGAIGGVLVCFGVLLLDKLKIDDPVGAFPVHGLGGIWGGIATGIFGEASLAAFSADAPLSLTTQLIGTASIATWALSMSLALFFGLKAIGMLRVHAEEEIAGLDISEHGMYAYPPNQVLDTYGISPVPAPTAGAASPAPLVQPSMETA
jgi:Amt family ammonium transporter